MGKIIFALLTAAIAWVLFKGFTKKSPGKREQPSDAEAPRSANKATPAPLENMVQCSRCGVHMPASESMLVEGKPSCRDPRACRHDPSRRA